MSETPKILCVDDREENLFSLAQMLAPTGAEILEARSGNDALLASLNNSLALAILDVEMPGMDGFEVAELLRQEERTKHLPIIFVSAVLWDDYHVFRGYEAGAVDFLVKPFNPKILLNKVRFFLQLDTQRRELIEKVQLEEANHHLEAILTSLTDAVFEVTHEAIVRRVNRAAVELCGYPHDELVGRPISELFPALAQVESTSPDRNEGLSHRVEFERRESQLLAKSGDTIPVLLSSAPVETPSGQTTGAVFVALDLARKLQAEKERTQLVTAIQQSRDGVVLLDTNARISYVNPAFSELIGISPHETTQMTLDNFDGPNASLKERRQQLQQGGAWQGQCQMRGAHDEEYEVEQSISPIRNAKGEVIGFVAFVRDLSAVRQLESQLVQAQKMEAMGNLARGIAHDFNNMLTPILGYTELSLEMIPGDSKAKSFLYQTRDAATRATQLVKQILAFGQDSQQDAKPMRLQSVLKEAGDLLRGTLPSTIVLEVDIDPRCGSVIAESTQIHQVVMNLGTNAYHAMEDEGGRLYIGLREVDLEQPESHNGLHVKAGACAALTIRDTGCGIPRDRIGSIFDPFFTTKEKRKGTGLGLATVHRIVKSFEGVIRVVSQTGQGTQFEVLLPLCRPADRWASNAGTGHNRPRGHERILVVDDEPSVAQFQVEALSLLGYSVTQCTNSASALRLFRRAPNDFDLVITDLTMPNLTGTELAAKVHDLRADIPVLLCSGFPDLITSDVMEAAGIHCVLHKPILQSELAASVRRALR